MKNHMKSFVAMLLVSLMVLALVGCSSSDGDKTADCPCAPCWTLPASICPAA